MTTERGVPVAQGRVRRQGWALLVLLALVIGGPPAVYAQVGPGQPGNPTTPSVVPPTAGSPVPVGTQAARAAVGDQPAQDTFEGRIVWAAALQPCPGGSGTGSAVPGLNRRNCQAVDVQLTQGRFAGQVISLPHATVPLGAPSGVGLQVADGVIVEWEHTPNYPDTFYIVDYIRTGGLLILALLFAGVAITFGRLRGFTSLLGLAVSFAIILYGILPALLAGADPLGISLGGAGVIMVVTLYLSHGFNRKTTAAVIGTAISLILTGLLAIWAMDLTRLSGFSSEEAALLQGLPSGPLNLRGILLGGIVIGALGVLNDITIGQASAVFELHAVDPRLTWRQLFRHVTNIGRDHIAATVNTLVLAYAGASLPLLLLFAAGTAPWTQVINGELVADEIVRTLVGSIGLITAVPITTALAGFLVTRARRSVGIPPVGHAKTNRL